MAISNFPPQAYTRDILAAAYEWLRNQPPSIRELAQDSDSLVALYMQARKRGGVPLTTHGAGATYAGHNSQSASSSASVESFKQELKTLTEGLKQFESAPTAMPSNGAPTIPSSPAAHTGATTSAPVNMFTPTAGGGPSAPVQKNVSSTQPQTPQPVATHPTTGAHTPMVTPATQDALQLDRRSMEIVHTVKFRFNLSSESEALRMLLTVGFDKIREYLPKM